MFHDPADFPFVAALEAACESIRAEASALRCEDYAPSPDSLTTVRGRYDETGWLALELFGETGSDVARRRCPVATKTCAAIPGLVNAGLSLLRPGTHLYPHRGEMSGVLRCHLALEVPAGDVGLRVGNSTVAWQTGRCLIFDDTVEHEAWNHSNRDRVVLLITHPRQPR